MMGLPDCRDVTLRLSREYDGAEHRRGLGVRLHLLICRACRHYAHYLAWLQRSLPRMLAHANQSRLSPAQRAEIRRGLQQQPQ